MIIESRFLSSWCRWSSRREPSSRFFFTNSSLPVTNITYPTLRNSSSSASEATNTIPKVDKKQKHIVVLGTGWGGYNFVLQFLENMKKKKKNHNEDDHPSIKLTVISPRNHFVFTPLLPSTAVGTLEPRCIQEPIRSTLSNSSSNVESSYIQAKARSLNTKEQIITCESIHREFFNISYDQLIIGIGVKTNHFGIKSITKNLQGYYTNIGTTEANQKCIFDLKQLAHARAIRANIIDCFERASIPTISISEKKRLLSFIIVGGGPTSCEFTAELHDFVKQDVSKLYPKLYPYVTITLVEAGSSLLGPFDKALQDYAYLLFRKRQIHVQLDTAVNDVEDYNGPDENNNLYRFNGKRAKLSNGTYIEFGTMVWSAGLAPRTFTQELIINNSQIQLHPKNKRIYVDDYLRVLNCEGTIWALGDAAVNLNSDNVPQLAQVARQQGIYLADIFSGKKKENDKPFEFFSLGSMAFLGDLKGVYDGSTAGKLGDNTKAPLIKGIAALILWRFAYWGRQTSLANKILIPVHWFKTYFCGRDTSRY